MRQHTTPPQISAMCCHLRYSCQERKPLGVYSLKSIVILHWFVGRKCPARRHSRWRLCAILIGATWRGRTVHGAHGFPLPLLWWPHRCHRVLVWRYSARRVDYYTASLYPPIMVIPVAVSILRRNRISYIVMALSASWFKALVISNRSPLNTRRSR